MPRLTAAQLRKQLAEKELALANCTRERGVALEDVATHSETIRDLAQQIERLKEEKS